MLSPYRSPCSPCFFSAALDNFCTISNNVLLIWRSLGLFLKHLLVRSLWDKWEVHFEVTSILIYSSNSMGLWGLHRWGWLPLLCACALCVCIHLLLYQEGFVKEPMFLTHLIFKLFIIRVEVDTSNPFLINILLLRIKNNAKYWY